MGSFLSDYYLWVKSLHVVAVIAWMAGLFYLPRLFVYHAEEVEVASKTDLMFQTMERRLLKAIMNPAMIVAWVFGTLLAWTPGIVDWSASWPWVKAAAVVGMTGFHMWLGGVRKKFVNNNNNLTGKQYRIMNEVPTVLMVVIVISVIVKF